MRLFRHHRGDPRSVSAVILPRRVRCFGRLVFALPVHYYVRSVQRDAAVLDAGKSCVRLNILRMPFRRRVRDISPVELQVAFRKMIPVQSVPAVQYGFLRRTGMLTAVWQHPGAAEQKTVLRLVQHGMTVCIFWFAFVLPVDMPEIEAVLSSMDMEPQ